MAKTAASQNKLEQRVAALEKQLTALHGRSGAVQNQANRELYCSAPQPRPPSLGPDVSLERARLLVLATKKWVNGTVLHYYFFDDPLWGAGNDQKDVVRAGFDVWTDVGIGIRFEEVSSRDDAEIRIGFQVGDGYWSYLGRDILEIGQAERTMNFGYDLTRDSRGVDVPVHEIGHTLGFPHEHQNPFSGIVWDREAVLDYFSRPPNSWNPETIEHNILRKLSSAEVEGSDWDADSIMHYAFDAGLIEEPEEFREHGLHPSPGLSDADREEVAAFYPPMAASYPELRPFELQRLSLSAGEQRDYTITPSATREYTIQTIGYTDSVMVLFEDRDGDFQYIAGDDDGGWSRNARLQLRLYAGRRYVLRIRLYYQWATGDTAVLMV